MSKPLPDGLPGLGIPKLNASFPFYCRDSAAFLVEGHTHGSREAGRLWMAHGPHDQCPTLDIPNPHRTDRVAVTVRRPSVLNSARCNSAPCRRGSVIIRPVPASQSRAVLSHDAGTMGGTEDASEIRSPVQ